MTATKKISFAANAIGNPAGARSRNCKRSRRISRDSKSDPTVNSAASTHIPTTQS